MRTLAFVCFALSAGVAVVSLAACGGSQSAAVLAPNEAPDTLPNHKTFKYRGTEQSFSVPAGVTSITVVARGAAGGGRGSEDAPRADGGRVYAVIPVTPEETLYVVVGGRGTRKAGGYNGGGKPGTDYYSHGFGGGGASDKTCEKVVICAR